jgi:SPP1 family predicted phage head-tail adaptor
VILAGKLDKRVSIKSQSTTRDALNQKSSTWNTLTNGDVWAAVEPLRNSETQQAMSNQMEITHRVTIRYRADVTADMRITFGARVLAIVGIRNPKERGEYLELLCLEGKHV